MSLLFSIFNQKLIPWAGEDLNRRLIVAQAVIKKSALPSDVKITPAKIPGKRVIMRNKRFHAGQRIYYASWPEAKMHELDVPSLICILNGVIDFQAGKYIITCDAGHFIFLPPRTPINKFAAHSFGETQKDKIYSCSLLQMNLYRDSIHCMIHNCRNEKVTGDPTANCLIRHPQTVQTFRLFADELSHPKSNPVLSGHLLSALFLGMSREIADGHQLSSAMQTPDHPSVPKSVQDIRDYIRTHLHDGLTIEKVARAMYISPSQFTHYIRDVSGQSFVEMLTECRVSEAKFLLQESQWSVITIAEQLGFKSATYFGAFFRRHVGVSPGFYRKNPETSKIQRK
jgi:AraC-like DNA-binding protein